MIAANQKQTLEFIKLCEIKDNKIYSPILWSITKKDKNNKFKYLLWQIILESDKPIHNSDIVNRSNIHNNVKYYTTSGIENGKITISSNTKINEGKNIGKKNETTILTQSLLNMRTQYNKKVREGRKINKKELLTTGISFNKLLDDKTRGPKPWRIIPMALKDVNNKKVKTSYWKTYVKYPVYVQPKYDGIRMLSVFVDNVDTIDIYSRGLEDINQQDTIKHMLDFLKEYRGLYLDGELWGEGLSLQTISGIGRRVNKKNNTQLKYYIYDCFMVDKPELTFVERYNILKKIKVNNITDNLNIVIVDSYLCNNKLEVMNKYTNFIDNGYEGAVIRNSDSKYEFGLQKEIRSFTTLKLKPNNDEEYIVINYKSGTKGKDKDAVIWVLQINEETIKRDLKYNTKIILSKDNDTFDAVSKNEMGIYENRYKIYKYLQQNPNYFKNNIYGKQMTVEFSIISDNGKPQQPKVKGFRDLVLQKKIFTDMGL